MTDKKDIEQYVSDAVTLLKQLIATPSISRDETAAADIMEQAMRQYGYSPERAGNNLWIRSSDWDDNRPIIMLNAHIDTVKPVATWTRDPFTPTIEGDRLYGLGSNDCGGGLVSLLQVFRILSPAISKGERKPADFNLIYLASCEEEVSGAGGIRSVINSFPDKDIIAIVGEPTGMQPAIAERGLMVIDGVAHGKSGHAARNEGVNAIYEALDDLCFIRDYKFEKTSPLLGPTKMQCTVVNSGTQHNVVPDECRFIIDVRTNEHYTNEEVFEFLQSRLKSEIKARSFHLHSSSIPREHPLIQRCEAMGMVPFGSPTLSDQALMRFPSFKLGPGESSRSHSADEYICISEIQDAISKYLQLLEQ
ncbi:MAG: M20 family metallo-hydrolase [Prevotella sp.]|nr:M20 family metallo-hydrolase [Prevotella sp.]MBR6192403.1 M20 family metallo-hydrolase [Prevotella sp.]